MAQKISAEVLDIVTKAREAAACLPTLSAETKNEILLAMSESLVSHTKSILEANRADVSAARKKGLSKAFIDRLTLTDKRIREMADSLCQIAALPDPIGEVMKAWRRPNGLWIHKVRTPIGVIAIIYESRPNVTSDCAALCFKSGNVVILRGGSETLSSNRAIYAVLKSVLHQFRIPEGAINLLSTSSRKAVDELLGLHEYVDLVMPRGGEGLIEHVMEHSRIPVIKHYKGICHVFVDDYADLNMAQDICFNAKVQRPGVCNAMECMLVHADVAARFLPGMIKKFKEAGVEIRGCPVTRKIVKNVRAATEKDYRTEYLDLILSVKVVNTLAEAITHINTYGSHHSDSIISEHYQNIQEFLKRVDSACVYVNASTRFTDGNQFGLGAEIGISTDKLHARGPMALEELTTYKYMIYGNGQVRT